MEEISQLLNAEELNHKETPIKLEDTGISLRFVSFSYDGTTEVLHDVNLAIHPGTMTAPAVRLRQVYGGEADCPGIGMLHPRDYPRRFMS